MYWRIWCFRFHTWSSVLQKFCPTRHHIESYSTMVWSQRSLAALRPHWFLFCWRRRFAFCERRDREQMWHSNCYWCQPSLKYSLPHHLLEYLLSTGALIAKALHTRSSPHPAKTLPTSIRYSSFIFSWSQTTPLCPFDCALTLFIYFLPFVKRTVVWYDRQKNGQMTHIW